MNPTHHLIRPLVSATLLIALLTGLIGCGSKGALYLPPAGDQVEKKNETEKKP